MKKILAFIVSIISVFMLMIWLSSCGSSYTIKIGMTKDDVFSILNEKEPLAYHSDNEKKYYWYDDTFYDLFTKYNINLKEESNQYQVIIQAVNSNDLLRDELNQLHFRYRFLLFDENDKLSEFYYDFDHRFDLNDDYSCFSSKTIDEFTFSKRKLEYYVQEDGQFKNNKNKMCYAAKLVNSDEISYTINFTDGTIFKGKLMDAIDYETETTVNKNKKTIRMYLDAGDYSFVGKTAADFKQTEILKNIGFECYFEYWQNFEKILDTASFVGFITKDNELLYWGTKLEYLPDTVDKDAFVGTLTEKKENGITYMGHILNPYYEVVQVNNKDTKKVEINKDAQIIKTGALCNLNNIYELVIPNGVKTIERGAISDCKNLIAISLPPSVEEIGNGNFINCPKLLEFFNGSNVYTEELALRVLFGGAHYYDTYNGNTDISYSDQVERIKHFKVYIKANSVFIFEKFDNSFISDSTKYEAGWYLVSAIGSYSNINLPDEIVIDKNTTITEYSIFPYAFYEDEKIVNASFGRGLKSIGAYAFYNCSNLKNFTGNGIKNIGAYAFYNCILLQDFTFESVESINSFAFENCNSLETIELPNYLTTEIQVDRNHSLNPTGQFYNCSSLTTVSMPNLLTMSSNMFSRCSSLTTVDIPKVTYVRYSAFDNCVKLESLTTGKLTNVEGRAFYNCTKLQSINLSDDLYDADPSAFVGCDSLEMYEEDNFKYISSENNKYLILYDIIDTTNCDEVVILDDVKLVNYAMFDKIPDLKKLTVQSSISFDNLRNVLNYLPNLEYYEEDGIYYIGSTANKYLAIVTVDKDATTLETKEDTIYIMDKAFENSKISSLPSIDNVVQIGSYAFRNTKIEELDLTNCYSTIDIGAFSDCLELNSVVVGYNFSDSMFEGCTKLKDVSFNICSMVPTGMFKNCSSLETVTTSGNGFEIIGYEAFFGCENLTTIELKRATTIYSRAFSGCAKLETVSLSSVTIVEYEAFAGTSIKTANLSNVETIGNSAFKDCAQLESIRLGENLIGIGAYAFSGCVKLVNMTIPDAVETLGDDLFSRCSTLSSVMIPDSLFMNIKSAFRDCPTTTNIYYKGTYEYL